MNNNFFGLKFGTFIFFLSSLFSACSNEYKEKIPDVPKLKTPIDIIHLEELIGDSKISDSIISEKLKKDDAFFCYYHSLMEFDQNGELEGRSMYKLFVSDSNILHLKDTVKNHFKDFKFLEKEMSEMFDYYKYYFPKNEIPKIATCISEFGPAASTCEHSLLLSLDMYLGPNYVYYENFDFPEYMQNLFKKEYCSKNLTQALVKSMMPDSIGKRLIDFMVAEGKVWYLNKKLMPYTHDSIITGFSGKDLKWLAENEKQIWGYFIENKLLYNTDILETRKFISQGPNTSGMPKEAPGNVGTWVGLQMIKKYMQKFPNTPLEELIKMSDGQKILTSSKYKP